MSIASAISNARIKITAAYTACNDKGASMPSVQNLSNLADTILSITGGSSREFDDWLHDGDTHVWVRLLNENQLTQIIRANFTGTIDWGDGNSETVAVTSATDFSHTYASLGRYRIDLHPTDGTFTLGSASSSYNIGGTRTQYYRTSAIYQVEVGEDIITTVSSYSFYYLYGLDRVYIPRNITAVNTASFAYCYGLRQVIFEDPSTLTVATAEQQQFLYCYNLQDTTNFAHINTKSMNSTFRNCCCLREVTVPSKVTNINNYALYGLSALQYLYCLPANPPTIADTTVFTGLNSACQIVVPAGSLSAYQSANRWSTYAEQMVEASSE